jgi:hypothetical protein
LKNRCLIRLGDISRRSKSALEILVDHQSQLQ